MSTDLEPVAHPSDHKSFWGHVEDLRFALVRSAMAVGIALVICLSFTNRLVDVLEYPLRKIDLFTKPQPSVAFQIGNTLLGPYPVTREQFSGLPAGAAPHAVFRIDSATVGQSQVATLTLLPDAADPGETLKIRLHNYGPTESFAVAFRVAIYGALVLASPIWMYYLGGFVLPALKEQERRKLFPWVAWSFLLFTVGIITTYFLLLPVALRASVEYSALLGFDGYEWRADDYVSFATHLIFGMGLGFQFPIVVLFLVKLGFLTHRHLAKYRRHVFLLCFILGAVLTTPEVVTQVAMAIPLYLLYEICIWIAWYWERKKRLAPTA